MKILMLCSLITTALISMPAVALNTPAKSRFDHRIRYVTYNADDVVQINTVIGVATHITLEPGEEYVTHAFGDSAAYEFAHKANHLFLKPKAELANTNLIVVTNRRRYDFRLAFQRSRANAVYEITFRYPDTEARLARRAVEKTRLDAAFKVGTGLTNLRYTMSGDTDIAPINAWDDGRFTYLKFTDNADFPAVYLVDAAGRESLVNTTVVGKNGNILKIHAVKPKYRLRLGERALSIWNDAYGSAGSVPNDTGTVSPFVERTINVKWGW